MMRKIIFFLLLPLFICLSGSSSTAKAQGYLHRKGQQIVDGSGKEVILRGMGLGGWMLQEPYMLNLSGVAAAQYDIKKKIEELVGKEKMNAFYDAWHSNFITKTDIDSMAAWGFNSVRLPMHYNLYTLPVEEEKIAGSNTWDEKGFALTDSLLRWCAANKMYLILDLHAAPGGQGADVPISDYDKSKPSLWQSEFNKQKTIALWRKLADRYKNEPWMGGYDLINETNWGFSDSTDKNGCAEKNNDPLRKLLMDITAAIREVDTSHIIYLEANCWANNYNGIFPLWDSNSVVSFHKYWNDNSPGSIGNFIRWREQYNVPIWMGESGENGNTWFRDAIALMETNRIGWAWWPLKKLRGNNPFKIPLNAGYQKLLDYWSGKSEKPSAGEAGIALMQLAADAHVAKNIHYRDVTDAMFRQVTTDETVPFKHHRIVHGTRVFVTDYDLGRNRFAYFDLDTANFRVSTGKNISWNKGGEYRNDGVDIEICGDTVTNGYNIGWVEGSEWWQFTIDVVQAGTYHLQVRSAAKDSASAIEIWVDDKKQRGAIDLPVTGGHQVWKTTTIKSIPLKKGRSRIKIKATRGGSNLNYIQFIKRK